MGHKPERTLIQLDWFAVTYRSVMMYLAVGVLLVLGGGAYWFYSHHHAPRLAAEGAIELAHDRLREARKLPSEPSLEATIASATESLDDARVSFAERAYDDARVTALHSADLSQQALDLARGNESQTNLVRFYRIEGDVRVKKRGEFNWRSASVKIALQIGDLVKTSSSGSAQLIYFDGTVTTIRPGSLLEIRDLFEDPVTKVRRVREKLTFGEVKASTSKSNVKGSFHEVSTEKVTTRSQDAGEFQVAYDKKAGRTVVDSFQGQVEVASGGRKESLVTGERISAGADGRLVNKQALPGVPRLVAPADQRVFSFETPRDSTVTLNWDTVSGASRYHLIIADHALFTDPLYDGMRDATNATLEVGPGSYFWKAAAVNDTGVEGPFSGAREFRVSADKILDRSDTEPPGLEITDFVTIGMMVIVEGQSEPGANVWVDAEKIDLYDDGSFNAVVRLRREGLNELMFRAQDTAGNETKLTRSAYVELY
jgi:hypothetical protein